MTESTLSKIRKSIEDNGIPMTEDLKDITQIIMHRKHLPLYKRPDHDKPFRTIPKIDYDAPIDVIVNFMVNAFINYKTHTIVVVYSGESCDYYYNDAEKILVNLMSRAQLDDYKRTILMQISRLEQRIVRYGGDEI